MRSRFLICGFLSAVLAAAAMPAFAQSFPGKQITLIVPLAAGGVVDTIARTYAAVVERNIGQRVLIDNRTGADGVIAAEAVKQARPDGYTILFSFSGLITTQAHVRPMPVDPLQDFQPITTLATYPSFLVVSKDSPVNSVAELIASAKQKAGGLNYGSAGVGTSAHFIGANFQTAAKVPMTHVPYRGGNLVLTDIIANRLDFYFGTYSTMGEQVKAGQLKVFAIVAPERWNSLPNVPTMAEVGYPDVEYDAWVGVLAPTGTPDDIIARLHDEFIKASKDAALIKSFNDQGTLVITNTPAQFKAKIAREYERFGRLVKDYGIKGD